MELVRGSTLPRSRRPAASTRERLRLFAEVCDAVATHRRGIVHRDLKPANVLVDESSDAPQVKVLDFGIARITGSDVATLVSVTGTGQLLGTLPYMSPEQASSDAASLDPRSDVYALGVLGYQLLCDRLPLDVVGKPLHEAVRIVREDEPTPASRFHPSLRGEIETILGKTLEKDPGRRYPSASELAADVRRHLSDEPIRASPPSSAYILRKFARRNRALVSAVAGAFLALCAGLVATAWQARKAIRERDRANEASQRAWNEGKRAQAIARFQREMLSRVQPENDGRDVKLADALDAAKAALPGDLAGDPAAEGGVRKTLGESYHAGPARRRGGGSVPRASCSSPVSASRTRRRSTRSPGSARPSPTATASTRRSASSSERTPTRPRTFPDRLASLTLEMTLAQLEVLAGHGRGERCALEPRAPHRALRRGRHADSRRVRYGRRHPPPARPARRGGVRDPPHGRARDVGTGSAPSGHPDADRDARFHPPE
jgi:hypothetical protein